jgi:ferrochelatase
MDSSDGILLVGHGTVSNLADIPAFLTRIRRGRPPSDDLVAEVRRRYQEVGGSPFLEVSRAQGDALSDLLGLPVFLGMNMWEPWIGDALDQAVSAGVRRVCIVPLAPFSIHVYRDAVEQAAAERAERGGTAPELCCVAPWGSAPSLVRAHADVIAPHLTRHPKAETRLVISAHSLPTVAIERGDPYQHQFESMAREVLSELGWEGVIAYQSQGMGGGAWLGPTVRQTLERAQGEGYRHVVWAPAGFLADHVETLYDLDIEAASWARELGLGFERIPALGVHPGLVRAMADAARAALGGGAS